VVYGDPRATTLTQTVSSNRNDPGTPHRPGPEVNAMEQQHSEPRREYARPRLTVYGDLRTLTLANPVNNQKNDPGNSSVTKT
jgi:hypothetical protein